MPSCKNRKLNLQQERDLAYERYSACAEHRSVQAAQAEWNEVAKYIQHLASKAFIERKEERANYLRDLADDISKEGDRRWKTHVSKALKEAAEAERKHIEVMEANEKAEEEAGEGAPQADTHG